MIALLKKDLPWLAAFTLGGAIATISVAFSHGFDRVLLVPDHRIAFDLGLTLWIVALALGVFAALRDDLTRTRPYLMHRALTPGRVFWTRALGCLAVVALWPLLAVLVLLAEDLVAGAGLAGLDAHAAPLLVALTAQAMANFAVALFVTSLPVSWRLRLFVALPAWLLVHLSVAVVAPRASEHAMGSAAAPLVSVVCAGLTAMFLVGAAGHERQRFDADLRLPRAVLRTSGLIAIGCALLGGIACVTGLQRNTLGRLDRVRPEVAQFSPSTLHLVADVERDHRTQRVVLDATHRPTSAIAPHSGLIVGLHRRRIDLPGLLEPRFDLRAIIDTYANDLGVRQRVSVTDAGQLDLLEIGIRNGTRRRSVLTRPDGRAFHARSTLRTLGGRGWQSKGPIAIGDPTDGSVWLLTRTPDAALTQQHLANGDRFVDFATEVSVRDDATGRNVEHETVIRGRDQTWLWRDGALTAGTTRPAPQRSEEPSIAVEVHDPDALTPEATFRAPDGATLRHRFALHTFREQLPASVAMAFSVVRPLPSALASLVADADAFDRHPLAFTLDPILIDGRRWLLALNVLLHLGLALSVRTQLRRRGVSTRRSTAWACATAAGGFLVLPLVFGIETRRAYARPPRAAARPVPLIESA